MRSIGYAVVKNWSARMASPAATRTARARGLLAICLLASTLGLGSTLQAQTADLAKLDAYIADARDDWKVPGLAVAVVKDGEVVLAKGYGVRELGSDGAVDENTLFAIASNTKAFTSAALARLVTGGEVDWDDHVVAYLPYFRLYSPFVTQEMRIRDLLCHRSGLGTFSGDLLWYGTEYTRADVVRRARYLPSAGAFRASYGYSNLMFIAAGEVVAAVSGQSWDDYVKTEFFRPLGMTRTVTSVDELAGMANVATPHTERDGDVKTFAWRGWDAMAAAGGIISSVSDMARWIRLQLGRGTLDGRTYFSELTSQTMWTPHNSFTVSRGSRERYPSTHFRSYGLGWGLMDYLGRKIVSHGGAYDGMFSRVALVPEENLGMVILTNSTTSLPAALMYRILDAYLGGEEQDWSAEYLERSKAAGLARQARWSRIEDGRVEGTQPSLPLERYAGTYGGPMYGDASVTMEDGRLVLQFLPAAELVGDLTHLHFDTFVVDWRNEFPWFDKGTVQFIMNSLGEVVEMKVDVPNEDFWFTELEFKRR